MRFVEFFEGCVISKTHQNLMAIQIKELGYFKEFLPLLYMGSTLNSGFSGFGGGLRSPTVSIIIM